MAVVAPWKTLSEDYNFKIKLVPSPSSKRGRAVRFALEVFERLIKDSPLNQKLTPMFNLKEAELSHVFVSGAKLSGPGMQSMKQREKQLQREKQKKKWLESQQFEKKQKNGRSQPKANPKKRKKRNK